MKRGDLVRLKKNAAPTPFRVADIQQGCAFVTCEISGHRFSGYIPEAELKNHNAEQLNAQKQTNLLEFQ